jgi:nitrite reductase (NO-forming)
MNLEQSQSIRRSNLKRMPVLLWAFISASLVMGCQQQTPTATPTAVTTATQSAPAELTFAPQVPSPITRSQPARVVVNLEVIEENGDLANRVSYNFWTYNGHVPGPFIRVRVGDTMEMHLMNRSSDKTHTVDFHAVTGPGGGAPLLMANPGQEAVASFKATRPGLYIYHCAANPIPAHIANGLYGLVLVEPEGGLARVDREFYVMQSEFYTEGTVGAPGLQAYSSRKAAAEAPEYVVFNGNASALTGEGALKARVGETVRIYFGNIGPNKLSAFHVIGAIFDRVYREGGLVEFGQNVQTTAVPPGSASVAEFHVQVPGTYTLVDHSIFRIDRGAAGLLNVEGAEAPDIYKRGK